MNQHILNGPNGLLLHYNDSDSKPHLMLDLGSHFHEIDMEEGGNRMPLLPTILFAQQFLNKLGCGRHYLGHLFPIHTLPLEKVVVSCLLEPLQSVCPSPNCSGLPPEVKTVLQLLRPDILHPTVIKEVAAEIMDALVLIFQNLVDFRMDPADWKHDREMEQRWQRGEVVHRRKRRRRALQASSLNGELYRNSKGFHSLQVQLMCHHAQSIMLVNSCYPGGNHNAFILHHTVDIIKRSKVLHGSIIKQNNLWNDQSLEIDQDLPPGWRTIRDTSGTYYWHVPTGTTQWQHPARSSDISLGSEKLSTALSPTLEYKAVVPGAAAVNRVSRGGKFESLMPASSSINLRTELPWQDSSLQLSRDPDSKCFAVRSLGWVEIPEEDLTPGKSSIAVNNCIQQLSHSKSEGRQNSSVWGEGQDMVMVLRKDTLSLVDPVDHSLIHSQPIINIRVWGVGCNNGRDFAFVASDKDTCMLKCHVFHCNTPAKAIATALHQMCSQIMAERAMTNDSTNASGVEEGMSTVDLPLQVDLLEVVRQSVQRFQVQYIGCLPVANSMGMKLVNGVIRKLLDSVERHNWPSVLLQVTDTTLSVCKGEESCEPWWECRVRYLTFLGVGRDPHTFGLIVDTGLQRFECHVFWCEPDAGCISEAIQAACMLQYQKCLVAKTPSARPKRTIRSRSPTASLKKHLSSPVIDGAGSASGPLLSAPKCTSSSNLKRSVMALLDTFKHKQSVLQMP
ncbi:amyloid-beta A4 precursor protein-binding family B member 3 [Heterodontus francisci]|uniref:amyloid-beta A4 precursor protein-binding family B member 3 n=1 Tax=Heterodontus francisci TaxID=7792 RepID=UPI00355BA17A